MKRAVEKRDAKKRRELNHNNEKEELPEGPKVSAEKNSEKKRFSYICSPICLVSCA